MKTSLQTFTLLIVGVVAIQMIGCGEDIEPEIDPIVFVSAAPSSGSEIAADGTITLTFDSTPADVSVLSDSNTKIGKTVITGKTVTIQGPFALGDLSFIVTWRDGSKRLTYTVTEQNPGDAGDVDGTSGLQPVEVSDETFAAIVLDAGVPVVLELRADWCGFCQLMKLTVEAVASEHSSKFIIARLDIDKNPETTEEYGGATIPAYIVFRNGKVVQKFLGVMSKEVFVQRIFDALK